MQAWLPPRPPWFAQQRQQENGVPRELHMHQNARNLHQFWQKSCPNCSPNGRNWHPIEQQYRQHIAKWLQSSLETLFDEIRFHFGCFWSAKWEPKLRQNWYQKDGRFCITCLFALGPFGTSFLSGFWSICDVLEDIAVKSTKM